MDIEELKGYFIEFGGGLLIVSFLVLGAVSHF